MELVISGMLFVKAVIFLFATMFLALVILFPVNDKPTSGFQISLFICVEIFVFLAMFGFVTFKIVA